MSLVATLISHPEARSLSCRLATTASTAVGASAVSWLAEGVACDLHLPRNTDECEVLAVLREAVDTEPVDVVVQPADGRRRRILVADMDSTMIDQECIDELADEIGLRDHVAAITARSMNGEIEFEPALRERVALLKGLDTAVIQRIVRERLTPAAGARTLVRTMRAAGAWTALVSGGFDLFTRPVAALLGFHEDRANRLHESNGRLTGEVVEPILGRNAKAAALEDIAARLGLSPREAIAVGDGANDLDMLRLAGIGVAMHAKPAVARAARIRIDHGDLTALLYLQGFSASEFRS